MHINKIYIYIYIYTQTKEKTCMLAKTLAMTPDKPQTDDLGNRQ